jgi:hypothetical protein
MAKSKVRFRLARAMGEDFLDKALDLVSSDEVVDFISSQDPLPIADNGEVDKSPHVSKRAALLIIGSLFGLLFAAIGIALYRLS